MSLQVKRATEALGERWVDFDSDVSVKLAGLDNDAYQIGLERARRLVAKSDSGMTLADVTVASSDRREYAVQCQLLARHIVLDWKGDVMDEDGSVMPYSKTNAEHLLLRNIEFFTWVVGRASEVADDAAEEAAETVGKSSPASAGSANSGKRAGRKDA